MFLIYAPQPNAASTEQKKRGRQRVYSDIAIEAALTVRSVYRGSLRQIEGLVTGIFRLLNVDLCVPDHTTLSRRGQVLELPVQRSLPKENRVIILDSTGLKISGEKEWMETKHGTKSRKTWRKLHICVDENGEILSSVLTNHLESDVSQVAPLLKNIEGPIATYLADGGYDQEMTYQAIEGHQRRLNQGFTPKIIIPPNTGFHKEKKTDPPQRLENIRVIQDKGKQKWQNITRYGRRSRVENTIYRYKSILGNKLKSKTFHNQKNEVQIGVSILNRMAALGMPRAQRSR